MGQQLSGEDRKIIDTLALQHGFSADAVLVMREAVVAGHGGMAQFDHPEFRGPGQWMKGGMVMVWGGDNALKRRIDALCNDLADLAAKEHGPAHRGGLQIQDRDARQHGDDAGAAQREEAKPGGATRAGRWWPDGLGQPESTGAQNGVRYAYFPGVRRLVIETCERVTVYDALDHRISGFAQQQAGTASLAFTSQHGSVDVASLPIVSPDGDLPQRPASPRAQTPEPSAGASAIGESGVFAAIEKLADLHAKGILTDEEFSSKKAELLGRL